MAVQTPNTIDLFSIGIHKRAFRNLSPSALYKLALEAKDDSAISSTGALISFSGAKTGRSPKDKRIVKNPASENDIWWGKINIPLPPLHTRPTASWRCAISMKRKTSMCWTATPAGTKNTA